MSTLTGLLFTPTPDPEDDVKARSGLFVKLVNQDTSETVTSTSASVDGTFSVTRPSPGTYYVSTSPDGTTWTAIGTQEVSPANADILHTTGDETAAGVKNLQTVYTQGPEVSADSIAFGTPGTDAAVQAALSTIQTAGGGVLKFSPNRTYSISNIAAFSHLHVIAHGATLQHTGSGVMIQAGQNTTGLYYFTWEGGKLVANPSAGVTTALVRVQNANYCNIDPAEIQGGDATDANKYATNGIVMYGRKYPTGGVYYCQIGGTHTRIHGCTGASIKVDGWDSTTSQNYVNNNTYVNTFSQSNGTGPELDGCQGETWIGGDSEVNAGVGLVMGPHPYYARFEGLWIEQNNGGEFAEQMSCDTTTDASAQQTSSFIGNCSTTAFKSYFRIFDNFQTREHGGIHNFNAASGTKHATFLQPTNFQAWVYFTKTGDAQPMMIVEPTGVGPLFKFGPGGSTATDASFGRTTTSTVGTADTATSFQPQGPLMVPLLGSGAGSGGGGPNHTWQAALGSTLPLAAQGGNGDVCLNTTNPGGYAIAYKAGGAWFWANGTVYAPSLTPTAVAASITAVQTFTVTGLTVGQSVVVNGPTPTAGTGIVGARVSAANTLALNFLNVTSGSLTPAAGVYTVRAT